MSYDMISFPESYVYFNVPQQDSSQTQRMTIGSIVAFEGGDREEEVVVLCDDLLGGSVYNPRHLIQIPTYGYRLVCSKDRYAIYREYSPPKSSGSDDYGIVKDLFTDLWLGFKSRPSRQLVDETEVGRAVNHGAPINVMVSATIAASGRRCNLQFPVRYISVRNRPTAQFHAEAGPILIPRSMLGDGKSEAAESMYIAQIGFNRWDEAEIAIWSGPRSEFGSTRSFREIRKLKADFSLLVDCGLKWR